MNSQQSDQVPSQVNYAQAEINQRYKRLRPKKSDATRQREYRARLTSEEVQERKVAAAAYMREYRARKKNNDKTSAILKPQNRNKRQHNDITAKQRFAETGDVEQEHTDVEDVGAATSAESDERIRNRRANAAKRSRDYRARKRKRTAAPVQLTSNQDTFINHEQLSRQPMTPTDTFPEDDLAQAKFKERFTPEFPPIDLHRGVCNFEKKEDFETIDIKTEPVSTFEVMIEPVNTSEIKSESNVIKSEPLDVGGEISVEETLKPIESIYIKTEPLSAYEIKSEQSIYEAESLDVAGESSSNSNMTIMIKQECE